MEKFDGIIIGGGPAGMMAAIRASEKGRSILLIEKNIKPGRKLSISGKGRCNLTNACGIDEFLENFPDTGNFLRNAFAKFFNKDLMDFFEKSGLKLKTERGGRVFPKSDKSWDVLNVLESRLNNKHVKTLFGESVRDIITEDKKCKGVITRSGKQFFSEHIAITTGALSYPETGSTGDGYSFAASSGHTIVPLKPALVPVVIKEKFVRDWQGISLKNVKLSLCSGSEKISEKFGEMLFTHFGISGPIVLDISASVYDALKKNKKTTLSINFKPALDYKKLDARLLREFEKAPNKDIKNIFSELLPDKLITHFLKYCRIPEEKKGNQITANERKKLIDGLFNFTLTVEGLKKLEEGIVTRGGVNTKEINPKTMESRLVKGLFFAGEVIDIDAKTGGYNMQAAFSTGWVCGDNL